MHAAARSLWDWPVPVHGAYDSYGCTVVLCTVQPYEYMSTAVWDAMRGVCGHPYAATRTSYDERHGYSTVCMYVQPYAWLHVACSSVWHAGTPTADSSAYCASASTDPAGHLGSQCPGPLLATMPVTTRPARTEQPVMVVVEAGASSPALLRLTSVSWTSSQSR
jgi:hypothetical protein